MPQTGSIAIGQLLTFWVLILLSGTFVELSHIQLEIHRALFEIGNTEFPLIPEHGVVKFPEMLLLVGAQRSFRGFLRMRVNVRERELPKDNPNFLRVVLLDLLQRRI